MAKENGLMPLANWLLKYETADPKTEAAHYVNQEVPDAEAALAGAHEISPRGLPNGDGAQLVA